MFTKSLPMEVQALLELSTCLLELSPYMENWKEGLGSSWFLELRVYSSQGGYCYM